MIDFSKIDENTVYSVKMSNGDEIITKIKFTRIESRVEFVDPLLVIITQQGIQFAPALFSADKTKPIEVAAGAIMMVVPAEDNAVAAHRKSTSGIEVPRKQIITG